MRLYVLPFNHLSRIDVFVVEDGRDIGPGGEVLDIQRKTVFCTADVAGEDAVAIEVEQREGIAFVVCFRERDGHLFD